MSAQCMVSRLRVLSVWSGHYMSAQCMVRRMYECSVNGQKNV